MNWRLTKITYLSFFVSIAASFEIAASQSIPQTKAACIEYINTIESYKQLAGLLNAGLQKRNKTVYPALIALLDGTNIIEYHSLLHDIVSSKNSHGIVTNKEIAQWLKDTKCLHGNKRKKRDAFLQLFKDCSYLHQRIWAKEGLYNLAYSLIKHGRTDPNKDYPSETDYTSETSEIDAQQAVTKIKYASKKSSIEPYDSMSKGHREIVDANLEECMDHAGCTIL